MTRWNLSTLVLLASVGGPVAARDWPMYGGDAARGSQTEDELPADLSLCWSYFPLHAPELAWPRDERMQFDRAFHVAVARGRLFFGSSADGKVYALDAATGTEQWHYFTDGPVRFAPLVWRDRLFVASDDGYLYCLNASSGQFIQKWRLGPDETRVLGNGRVISKWPARGGPTLRDDVLYWAAGIWQSDGVFLAAMNPASGQTIWRNDKSGGIEMPQPHGGANARSGVTAQGYLLATPEQLFVPTGRAVPAAFSRSSGDFQYYHLQANGQRGGTFAMAAGPFFYNGGAAFDAASGAITSHAATGAVCTFPKGILQGARDQIRAFLLVDREAADRKGKPIRRWMHEPLWEVRDVPAGSAIMFAGQTVVSARDRRVAAVDVSTRQITWSTVMDDDVWGLAAAEGRLYVSTASGAIHAFGRATSNPPMVHRPGAKEAPPEGRAAAAAEEILQRSGIRAGYCVDLACGSGDLALELARRSQLQIVAIDADPDQVAKARQKLDAAGYYGVRVTVHQGDPAKTHYPKYFANLVVSGRSLASGPAVVPRPEVERLQRPFGGVACYGVPGSLTVRVRGPLEKAGEWTHLYADPANTICSTDEIRGPLTMLWFRDVDLGLPQRHGRGPAPLFREGRLFVEGLDGLMAVDAYNGRSLWRFDQPGILEPYNADHLAGTAVTSSNFCVAGDNVFLRNGGRCFRLEAATGKVAATYDAPPRRDGKPPTWGYLACADGILFGSIANDAHIVRHTFKPADLHMPGQLSESMALFALDVASGRLLWRYDARESIRHNAVAIGKGRVFLVDRQLAEGDLLSRVPKQGEKAPADPPHATGEFVALDAKTGSSLWRVGDNVFGTMLAYSEPHDRLLMCYQATRFKQPSERSGRMAVYRATTGERLWEKSVDYATRPLVNDRQIVAYPELVDLLTGEVQRLDFVKSYGCGQLSSSRNLLLFRSATLGYYDFTRRAGTENFGGMRPGCWINALPVGGLVLVPDASAGCRCSYQARCWVALEGT